jgi:hypothetical protein
LSRPGQAPLDWWSWVHLATGAALAIAFAHWWAVLAILCIYEVLEGGLRRIKLEEGGLFEHESWLNIVTDIAVGMVGFTVGHLLYGRWAWW